MYHSEPLAHRMRPRVIEDVVGQDHIIGEGSALHKMIKKGHVPSLLLYGPPGTGKTSLAFAIANSTKKDFFPLHANTAGKKDIEDVIAEAKLTRNAILFIDEIHLLNKTQQDALLKALEEGIFTLIGATTENPFPCSPALAASIAAFKASKFVCSVISVMTFVIDSISAD